MSLPPDPFLKRYSCTQCNTQFTSKTNVNNHIKRKNKCGSNPTVKETLFTNCPYCNTQIKTICDRNFMEDHIKICLFKLDKNSNSISNNPHIITNNNFYFINLNSYSNPDLDYIGQIRKIVNNRSAIYRTIYFNEECPENHSIKYDPENGIVRLYDSNSKYSEISINELHKVISEPLDRAQEFLIKKEYQDPEEFKEITKKIDKTYSKNEKTNKSLYEQITKDNRKLVDKTISIIEEQERIRQNKGNLEINVNE